MPYAVAGRTRGLFGTFRLAGLAAEATDLSIRLVYLTNQAQNEQVALFSGIAMLQVGQSWPVELYFCSSNGCSGSVCCFRYKYFYVVYDHRVHNAASGIGSSFNIRTLFITLK